MNALAALRERHDAGGAFSVTEVNLAAPDCYALVALHRNPPRFHPGIFGGDWAKPSSHPAPGTIRILRVMTGQDGVTRVIGRQGDSLYAYPWLG
jgi:hypothetical protein